MMAPNLAPDAILGINFLQENDVVINVTEGRFTTRRDGCNCEHKFLYDSLPKNKVGVVGLISNPKFQLNLSESQRQPDGKDYLVGAQNTHALIPLQQQNQKELLNTCDEIKVNGVGYYAGNGETFVLNDVGRRDEAVPDKEFYEGRYPN
jgi:hypothetical protein